MSTKQYSMIQALRDSGFVILGQERQDVVMAKVRANLLILPPMLAVTLDGAIKILEGPTHARYQD